MTYGRWLMGSGAGLAETGLGRGMLGGLLAVSAIGVGACGSSMQPSPRSEYPATATLMRDGATESLAAEVWVSEEGSSREFHLRAYVTTAAGVETWNERARFDLPVTTSVNENGIVAAAGTTGSITLGAGETASIRTTQIFIHPGSVLSGGVQGGTEASPTNIELTGNLTGVACNRAGGATTIDFGSGFVLTCDQDLTN